MKTRALVPSAILAAGLAMHAPTASALSLPNIHAFTPCSFGALSGGCGGNGGRSATPNVSATPSFGLVRILTGPSQAGSSGNSGGNASRVSAVFSTTATATPTRSEAESPNAIPLPLPFVLLSTALLGLGALARRKA